MVIMVCVVSGLSLLLLGLATARWFAARAVEDDLDLPTDDEAVDRLHLLPKGHRPPPGLSPLSPSERFLAAEASRGLRDLEKYLSTAA